MNKKIKISLVASILATTLGASDNLANITVTSATKSEQSIKDVTSNINVITALEIEERQYTTVVQALNSIAGISFTSNGGMGKSTSVSLRGMSSKRILVLIDGIRYNDITSTSGAPFSHLMISDIKQIEVVKGAQSGIWGADASAGVINIITKDTKKGLHGTINAEYGSFNTKKYGMSASYKKDKLDAKISSSIIESNGFTAYAKKGVDINTYEDDGYKNTTNTFKVGYKINDNNKINILRTNIDATSEYDSTSGDSDMESITNNKFTSITYKNKINNITSDIFMKQSKFDRASGSAGSMSEFDGEVNEYGIKSKIDYNKKDFIIVGSDIKDFEHKNTINKTYKNKAIFLTNSNLIDTMNDNDTIFTQSIRYDNFDTFNNKTTGKLGLKYFRKDFVFSTNYGTAYNVPTLYNLYSAYGSTTITPEETKSFDISAKYKDMKVTFFNNKVSDMIDYDMTTHKYNNIDGTSTLKGTEVEYIKQLADNILLSLNYTNLNAKDKDDKDLKRQAKENLKISTDYYGLTNYHFNLNGEYVGERFNDSAKTQQTGKYTVINTVINYDIKKDLKVYIKVDNLTDKYYQTVENYATSPRAYYIGLKCSF